MLVVNIERKQVYLIRSYIMSGSRDVTCQSLQTLYHVRLHRHRTRGAGLTRYLVVPLNC